MVDQERRHEIGVLARNPDAAHHHHRLLHVEIDRDHPPESLRVRRRDLAERGLRRQGAENLVDQGAGGRAVDIADDADLERVAGKDALHVGPHVLRRDRRHAVERAAHRPAVRVAREGGLPPAQARHVVRIGRLAAQDPEGLAADALEVRRVQPRRVEGEAHHLEGRILVLGQGAQRAGEMIAVRREAELDRLGFQPLVEGLGVEIAGALVDHPGHQAGDAGLVGRVLAGAAAEREIHRDQRVRGFLHEPDLDAARTPHAFDLGRRGRRRHRDQQRSAEERASDDFWQAVGRPDWHVSRHERFSSGNSLTR